VIHPISFSDSIPSSSDPSPPGFFITLPLQCLNPTLSVIFLSFGSSGVTHATCVPYVLPQPPCLRVKLALLGYSQLTSRVLLLILLGSLSPFLWSESLQPCQVTPFHGSGIMGSCPLSLFSSLPRDRHHAASRFFHAPFMF
jgi:hypothetical protein